MIPTNVLILTAVMIEARTIARRLNLTRRSATAFGDARTDLQVIGIRGSRLETLPITPDDYRAVILAGLAGALDPALPHGALLVDVASTWRPAALERSSPLHIGPLATATGIVATPAQKAALFQKTAALAVEMEAEAVRRHFAAFLTASPPLGFLHLRAVSDTASETLDPSLLPLIDDLGRPRPFPLAKALMQHPRRLVDLMRVGRHARDAADRVAKALQDVMASL